MNRKPLILAVALLFGCDTSSMTPNSLAVQESNSSKVPHAAESASVTRWEGENVFYFTKHAPGTGIYANPFSFDVYLSNLPVSFAMSETGATWTRVAPDDAISETDRNYAFRLQNRPGGNPNNANDLRNILTVSPAQRPMLIDHGKTWKLGVTDNGGSQSGQPAITNQYSFTYVDPGRCRINAKSVSPPTPGKDSTVTFSASVGPYCKRVWVTATDVSGGSTAGGPVQPNLTADPVGAIFDATAPGLGTSQNISVSRLVRDKDVVFRIVAIDAAGARVSDTVTADVQLPATPTTQPAGQCPANSGGFPISQTICVSCPSGGGSPYTSTVVGDYCNASDAISALTPLYGNCSLTSGSCP